MREILTLFGLMCLFPLGCESGELSLGDDDVEHVGDDDDSQSDDDDVSDDDDTGDDDVADDDTGDDDDTVAPDTMAFDIEGEWSTTALELIWFEPGGTYDEELDLFAASVDGDPLGAAVPDPPADQLWEAAPGFEVAMYVPVLFEDLDGDAERDPAEAIVGLGRTWPTWGEGSVPPEFAAAGVVAGWNAIEMDLDDEGAFEVHDVMAIPLAASLWPVESLQLGGSYLGDLPTDEQRLAVVPVQLLEGAPINSLLFDQPLTQSWALTVSGDPPPDHQTVEPESGLAMAAEIPLTYSDVDGSGGLTAGDQPQYCACHDGNTVVVYWAAAATTFEQAWIFEYGWSGFGGSPGYFATAIEPDAGDDEPPIPIDPADLLSLEISGACSLE